MYTFLQLRSVALRTAARPLSYRRRHFGVTAPAREYVPRAPAPGDRVYVAMSSGVDSSTVAALIRDQYPDNEVSGIYMENWNDTSNGEGLTCTEREWIDVQKVCQTVGLPCERVNFEREYWNEVFMPMIEMYKQGLTPNPDVGCNKFIKFGELYRYLEKKEQSTAVAASTRDSKGRNWWLATGHYANVGLDKASNTVHLLRPTHLPKDQSYYLSAISSTVLPRLLFPLGGYTKPQVRDLALKKYNLPTAEKPDSQGICFIGQGQNTFRRFLDEYLEANPGDVVTETGEVVGRHNGLWHATVGQRSGIAMPQGDPAKKGTWYVARKVPALNQIVIVRGADNPAFFTNRVQCAEFDWLGHVDAAALERDCAGVVVQYRSLQTPERVRRVRVGDSGLEVEFETLRRAVAPGQYLVMYNEAGRVLGSGVITNTDRTEQANL